MTVTIIPNAEVTTGGSGFILNPSPSADPPLGTNKTTSGPIPWLYETINPGLTITITTGTGMCGPVPDLILSAEIYPGTTEGGGIGCSVAVGGVGNIPEFALPGFNAPLMKYGKYPGNGTQTLPMINPLIGMYTEKYFWDQEYIWATYYENTDDVKVNKLEYLDLIKGNRFRPIDLNDEKLKRITKDDFTKIGDPIDFNTITIDDVKDAETIGPPYLDRITKDVTAWVKYKPSFIQVMRYYYVIRVTHACPPFVSYLYGHMDISNNWSLYGPRLEYYIEKGVGFN